MSYILLVQCDLGFLKLSRFLALRIIKQILTR